MSLYKFALANYCGCYVGISATSLKDATEIYSHIARNLCKANDNHVKRVTVKKDEVILYDRTINKN